MRSLVPLCAAALFASPTMAGGQLTSIPKRILPPLAMNLACSPKPEGSLTNYTLKNSGPAVVPIGTVIAIYYDAYPDEAFRITLPVTLKVGEDYVPIKPQIGYFKSCKGVVVAPPGPMMKTIDMNRQDVLPH